MPTRVLFDSPVVSVYDYHCDGHDSRADERAADPQVVFVRSGVFRIESERGRAIADPVRAVLLRGGEGFRVTHPGACEDRCLVVRVTPGTLREIVATRAPRAADREAAPFPGLVAACDRALYAAQRRLAARLERGDDALAVEEEALAIVESLMTSAWAAEAPVPRPIDEARDERVAAVRAQLAVRLDERLSLAGLATSVDLSPSRLARRFRAATGTTIHAHRVELRLRAAVERLGAGEADLTGLALDLGFSDHAHFTNTFRRRFGVPPSRFRDDSPRRN